MKEIYASVMTLIFALVSALVFGQIMSYADLAILLGVCVLVIGQWEREE